MDILSPDSPQCKHYVYTLAYPDGTVFYIGKGAGKRIDDHEREARREKYRSSYKLNTIRKIWADGGQIVKSKLGHFPTNQEALLYEVALIFFMDGLTNVTDGGDGADGYVHTEDEIRKIKAARQNQIITEEHKRKIGESHKTSPKAKAARRKLLENQTGRSRSEETLRRMSEGTKARPDLEDNLRKMHEANRGRVMSEEERKKRSEALKGRPKPPRSEEHRRKLGAAHKGKTPPPLSEEARKKISEARKDVPLSEEHRRHLSEAHKGPRQPLSEETKRKISEANKGRVMHSITDEMLHNLQAGRELRLKRLRESKQE